MIRKAKKKRHPHSPSVVSRQEIFLNRHDEEKVLLFASGILFGVGVSSTLLGTFWYTGISILAFALVLMFVEARQD